MGQTELLRVSTITDSYTKVLKNGSLQGKLCIVLSSLGWYMNGISWATILYVVGFLWGEGARGKLNPLQKIVLVGTWYKDHEICTVSIYDHYNYNIYTAKSTSCCRCSQVPNVPL